MSKLIWDRCSLPCFICHTRAGSAYSRGRISSSHCCLSHPSLRAAVGGKEGGKKAAGTRLPSQTNTGQVSEAVPCCLGQSCPTRCSSPLQDAAVVREEPRRSEAVWCHLPAQRPGSGPSPAGAPPRVGNSLRGHCFWAETGEVVLAPRSLTSIASAPSVPTLVTDLK